MGTVTVLILSAITARCIIRIALGRGEEEVVAAYFAAIDVDGFASTSRFFHPSALAEFQTLTLPIFESEARDGASEFRRAVFGPEASLESLRAMEPTRFYRRFMSFMERQMGPTTRIGQQVEVLGSVIEDGTLAHVVVRARLGPPTDRQTRVDVVSLERTETGWGVLLSNELQGLAGALRPRGSGATTP